MKVYRRAVLPIGFKANGVCAGIKKSGKLDLALLYSEIPAKAACMFTTNKIPAAPILFNKAQLKKGKIFQALIVNSGNANCFTGRAGLKDAEEVAEATALALRLKKENILVASTGIIGRRLAVEKIKGAASTLVNGLSTNGIGKAKSAIMTTDTFAKEITVACNIQGCQISLCGIAKGAGMIAPNLATMLCFLLTDANITQRALKRALAFSVQNSFNCITVDGCMSTNDSVMMLANGAAGNPLIDKGRNFNLFVQALNFVCLHLAKIIIQDAEGSNKFIEIKVTGAKDIQAAKKIALSIANSNLFKTAMYGENPNFGRIVASVGASGVSICEKELKVRVSPLVKREIKVEVSVGRGRSCATVYTSDLTPEYVRINAQYS